MLRDFLDWMYINTENKDEENQELLAMTESFLTGELPERIDKYDKIIKNKYLAVYRNNKLAEEVKKIIDNIGEDVVRQHLNKMYYYLENSE